MPEQGFAAAFGEETSPGQGQGPGQQSMKILWMQNSFSRLMSRALGLLVRIQRAGERPAARQRHRSPPHLRPLGPYARFWTPTWGSSTVPSVQPGTGLSPEPFGLSRARLRCFTGRHRLQPRAVLCRRWLGTGISPKQSTERPNLRPKGQDPDRPMLTHRGMLTRG